MFIPYHGFQIGCAIWTDIEFVIWKAKNLSLYQLLIQMH